MEFSSTVATPATDSHGLVAELTCVTFAYGSHIVLDHLTMRIPAGQFLAVIGPNGSGKSTLAHVLSGIDRPDLGSVTLLGHRVFDSKGIRTHNGQTVTEDADAYKRVRRSIGFVVQSPENQIVMKPVQDDVAFGPENVCVPSSQITDRVHRSLETTGIAPLALADPDHLSGGQQQRVAIAGAWAMSPRLIVLDEPGAMLDAHGRDQVMHEIMRLKASGVAIVLVTHRRHWAMCADRVVVLKDHRIVRDGRPDDIVRSELSSRTPSASRADRSHRGRVHSGPSTAVPVCIRAHRLGFSYSSPHSSEPKQWVFRGVNLTIRRGEIIVLTGDNGSGKSTLLAVLSGLRRPSEGSVEADPSARIGVIVQRPEYQFSASTVLDDVSSTLIEAGMSRENAHTRAHQLLQHMGLGDREEMSPWDLSGGQQRLAGIAGVLVADPDVVMMDEPFDGLDARARKMVAETIAHEHARGKTVIVVTHDLDDLVDLPTRMIRMADLTAHMSANRSLSGPKTHDSSRGETAHSHSSSHSHRRSPLAQLDPRTTVFGSLLVMASVFLIHSLIGLAFGAAMIALIQMCARMSPRALIRRSAPFPVFIVLMALFNLFAVRDGTVWVTLGPIRIMTGGLWAAVLYSVRLLMLVLIGALVLGTIGSTTCARAIASVCEQLDEKTGHRLTHLGDCALIVEMSFRFMPLVTSEFRRIRFAQRARGTAVVPQKGRSHHHSRVKKTVQLLIPVCTALVRRAHVLGVALDARCYEPGKQRTQWHPMRMRAIDGVAWAIIGLWLAGLIAVRVVGPSMMGI